MKIGILSLKYTSNYGGILQSLALQEYLKSLDHEVEIINFCSIVKETIYHRILYSSLNLIFSKHILDSIKDKIKEKKKLKKTDPKELIVRNEQFMKKFLNRTKIVNEYNIENFCKKYDCIVVGSDQVWSVTNASKLIYFIDWNYKGKRIAYSACSVNREAAILNKSKILRLLKNFEAISVRDFFTQNFVYNLSKNNPLITADPTLLVNFDTLIPTKRLTPEPYILVYILGDEITGSNKLALEKIRGKYGHLKIISVEIPSISIAGEQGADLVLSNCTPVEWLSLIKYANFIYTDSFHGCIFSIKYNKPFIGYYKYMKRSTRLIDLERRYKLKNIISNVSQIDNALKYDCEKNDSAINDSITISMKYLKSVL